jgi:hypothetical protein
MNQHFFFLAVVLLLVMAHLLNVRAAISLISVPVGPHGSLLVAVSRRQLPSSICCSLFAGPTISNLDLHVRISFRDILNTPYHFRHGCCNGRLFAGAGIRVIFLRPLWLPVEKYAWPKILLATQVALSCNVDERLRFERVDWTRDSVWLRFVGSSTFGGMW